MKLARLLLPAMALGAMIASAQNLDVNTGDPSAGLPERPARGASMATVEARFGTPLTKHAAVGNPPITRWDYARFSVFFEYDRVLHAVVVRSGQPADG
jgi:hypothetical protein